MISEENKKISKRSFLHHWYSDSDKKEKITNYKYTLASLFTWRKMAKVIESFKLNAIWSAICHNNVLK